jgi:nucleoside-diphosphate-sugar epimerase
MVLESLLGERRVDLPGQRDYIRDFVHIDDVTRLSVAAITGASRSPVTIMNAGSGEAISLAQLAEYGSDIVGYDLPISFRTPGPETLTRSHACLELTAERFGYRPRYQLREGLADTIEWFMSTNARARKLGTR